MSKKVVVISTSLRASSNSEALAKEFVKDSSKLQEAYSLGLKS